MLVSVTTSRESGKKSIGEYNFILAMSPNSALLVGSGALNVASGAAHLGKSP